MKQPPAGEQGRPRPAGAAGGGAGGATWRTSTDFLSNDRSEVGGETLLAETQNTDIKQSIALQGQFSSVNSPSVNLGDSLPSTKCCPSSPSYSDQEVWDVLEADHKKEFLREMEDGLENEAQDGVERNLVSASGES